jgi:hypothetical protein
VKAIDEACLAGKAVEERLIVKIGIHVF